MYLHHLRLAAIGPYAETVDIDFAALGASGVFLLEGPTGAGKSTIIDAVVFALYGSLAGEGASKDRLHSHHADAGVEPFVELVFETAAGVHRVRRTPAHDRPKKSGGGTTRQNASARLWRLAAPGDAVGEPLSIATQEVGAEVQRIIGLDRAQFVQTVVLPQGEFARFLRAPGEDRRALLQSLFGTDVYERTTEELVARRRAAAAAVERADAAVHDALNRLAEAAGLETVDELTADAVVAEVTAAAHEATTARDAAAGAAARARADLADAERRARSLRRRADLLRRQAALSDRAEQVAGARARLELAERAGRVLGLVVGLDTARTRAERRGADLARVVAEHRDALTRHTVGVGAGAGGAPLDAGGSVFEDLESMPAVDTTALAAHAAALRDVVAGARHAVALERDLPARRAALASARTELARAEERRAALEPLLDARPAERLALVTTSRAAADRAADGPVAERALADLDAVRALLDDRDRAAADATAADADLAAASLRAQAAITHEADLRTRRAAGLAGELAGVLTPGEPCPVCGSVDHPAVAAPLDGHPTDDDIEAAADARATADVDQRAAAARQAVARRECDRLTTAIGAATPESVAATASALRDRIARAHAAAAEVARAEERLEAFDRDTRALAEERSTLAAQVAAGRAGHAADAAALAADEAIVERCRASVVDAGGVGTGSLDQAVAALDRDAAACAAVAAAADALRSDDRDVLARAAEVERALGDAGFADADAARAAGLGPDEAARLRSEVAGAEREHAVVQAGLAEADVAAAEHDAVDGAELEAVRTRADGAEEALQAATGAAATAEARAVATSARRADLTRAVRARQETSAESRAVVRLADIATAASSVNPTGITLGTYVLMRRFEDVVAAANSRLGAMLGGRFALEASDERETSSRARRTGLALAVRDHETGRTRDPRSLSGGETFTTSLCLALGLADVVQAEAGGVELGTLFVDEGFGTLDPETLDGVVGQLTRLTAGGRQVGIVSHVEELKQRIPDRIEVRRAPGGGSTVRTTV
ncbi:AAA family ATPase [Curtobacterium sp. MCBD17_040]|uniref:AAA family ATPase n=1 Tax=Curtobacterium sp. MCBD17_040 TaxID=2175674 RepID=UPI000DA9070F|nr:AAA family ATPase [Curtobacterium sp. MCBD17_040]WIB64213.1 AAA family ATPase [Curtobacterium sp. MCBD17_040]